MGDAWAPSRPADGGGASQGCPVYPGGLPGQAGVPHSARRSARAADGVRHRRRAHLAQHRAELPRPRFRRHHLGARRRGICRDGRAAARRGHHRPAPPGHGRAAPPRGDVPRGLRSRTPSASPSCPTRRRSPRPVAPARTCRSPRPARASCSTSSPASWATTSAASSLSLRRLLRPARDALRSRAMLVEILIAVGGALAVGGSVALFDRWKTRPLRRARRSARPRREPLPPPRHTEYAARPCDGRIPSAPVLRRRLTVHPCRYTPAASRASCSARSRGCRCRNVAPYARASASCPRRASVSSTRRTSAAASV